MHTEVSMAGWVLCMTLVLAALAGAQETPYQRFLRKHVDNPQTSIAGHRYCDTMMRRRNVNVQGGPCKTLNTFVHAPAQDLVDACRRRPIRGYYITPRALRLTDCHLRAGNTRPPCRYTGIQQQRRVVVACENRRPSHLETTSP